LPKDDYQWGRVYFASLGDKFTDSAELKGVLLDTFGVKTGNINHTWKLMATYYDKKYLKTK
jgi:hypothetical protein